MSFEARNGMSENLPDKKVSVRETFKIDMDMEVPAFSEPNEYVPDFDPDYLFDKDTTLALLAGFAFNRRVIVQGYHGTGKSTHIEQVAARLNWPCIRINLDSHISRIDLVGKDAIVLKEGKQVTEFREGILPWALQHPVALVFDEYDAGRPDVMFVIQRVLEASGKLTLLDQNRVIRPHPAFRLFATANTVAVPSTHLTLPTIYSVYISVVAVSLKKKNTKKQKKTTYYNLQPSDCSHNQCTLIF